MNDIVKKGEEFTCANCGGIFTAARDEEIREDEYTALFGGSIYTDDAEVVCDPCWQLIVKPFIQ